MANAGDGAVSGRRLFGIELEFFLVDESGRPVLDASYEVLDSWRRQRRREPLTHELSSFQIELNPGPWPLDPHGIAEAIDELRGGVDALTATAEEAGLRISTDALAPVIDRALVEHPRFFTDKARYRASSSFFARRSATLRWADGRTLELPGETIVGCLDEIHIHAQLESDAHTLDLFNYLNVFGESVCAPYATPLVVNGAPLAEECTTRRLFAEANGDWNRDGTLRRVGDLPAAIDSARMYRAYVDSFARVPCSEEPGGFLDPVTTTYFWTRLRGEPGALRVEFRPMEMGADWPERVHHLASTVLAFAGAATEGPRLIEEREASACPVSI